MGKKPANPNQAARGIWFFTNSVSMPFYRGSMPFYRVKWTWAGEHHPRWSVRFTSSSPRFADLLTAGLESSRRSDIHVSDDREKAVFQLPMEYITNRGEYP